MSAKTEHRSGQGGHRWGTGVVGVAALIRPSWHFLSDEPRSTCAALRSGLARVMWAPGIYQAEESTGTPRVPI